VDEVELVRSVYERWARADDATDLFHPDVDWRMPHPGGQVRGRRQTAAFLREFVGAWKEHQLRLEELRPLGEGRVLVLFTERGIGRGSGVPTEAHPAAIWTIGNGLVTRFEGFADRAQPLAAAGV
jgi:ketosteroid isomerase-like protein